MLVLLVLGSACVTLAAMLAWTLTTKAAKRDDVKLPPGPCNMPILGQAFQFPINRSHFKFTEWSKEFGDIFMFRMLGRNVMILNHPDIIRRAFASKEYSKYFNDRPPSFVGHFIGGIYKDILFRRYDETCQKLKTLTLQAMHQLGEGSSTHQSRAMLEIRNYIADISATPDRNVNIIKPLEVSLCRMIGLLITGELFQNGDQSLKAICEFDVHGNEIVSPAVHTVFKFLPFIRHLPGYYGNLFKAVLRERTQLRTLFVEQMKERYMKRPEQCFVHELFKLQETEAWLTDDLILGVVMDLINTSTLTSRGVLSGFLLLLVNFQDVQSKIREEVYQVIGKEKHPQPEHLAKMPYTHACILETLRYQSHLSLSATHTNAFEDVTFEGYLIPKGTAIYANQWCVHHDERFWEEPWTFRPERFLQADGNLVPPEHDSRRRFFMPFGVGKRACMGINMSYNRAFLYITALLQNHVLLPPVDAQLQTHDPKSQLPGTVLQAPNFLCRVAPVSNG